MNPIQSLTTLEEIEGWIWDQLVRATHDRHSAFKWPVMSTTGADNTPQARMLALRKVNRNAQFLDFYTDKRSEKVRALELVPSVSLVFFDPKAMVQLRLTGHARLHNNDPVWQSHFDALADHAKRDYTTINTPGSQQSDMSVDYSDALVSENFLVIRVEIKSTDWLSLSREGHRRASFTRQGEGVNATWLTP